MPPDTESGGRRVQATVKPLRESSAFQPQRNGAALTRGRDPRVLARPSRRIRRQRLSEERLRRGYATIPSYQKIDAFALLVHSLIQVVPFAANGNVRLVYPPRRADAARMSIPSLLELGTIPNDPS
jgi:hypothetical protein